MCASCRQVSAVAENEQGNFQCALCGQPQRLCCNYVEHAACNCGVAADDPNPLCSFCRLNSLIPDLSVESNLLLWQRLEAAKHRVLYDMERIGFPVAAKDALQTPQLKFEFKAAVDEPVSTGHAQGLITIDIAEADSVHRERNRVQFGEPQRTLVGHFRHELGHYYWELLVRTHHLSQFRKLFGDERTPNYADAQKKYYAEGAPSDWQATFISAYASMHPWEDFAETFAAYMDMVAIIHTAGHFQLNEQTDAVCGDFKAMLTAYRAIGIVANELNRDVGLLDLVPEVFTDPVVEKLNFVHSIRSRHVQPVDPSKIPVATSASC